MEYDYISNKEWMYQNAIKRLEPFFINGVRKFVEFAKHNQAEGVAVVLCPCKSCANRFRYDEVTVINHIISNGFIRNYIRWNLHGERSQPIRSESKTMKELDGNMIQMVHDAFGQHSSVDEDDPFSNEATIGNLESTRKYDMLLEMATTPLYPGCKKYSTLTFLVKMLKIKTKGKVTNTSFSEYLELLKDAFPDDNTIPNSWSETQKILADLGHERKKYDSCKNDCILFYKEYSGLHKCPVCGAERWKDKKAAKQTKNVANKVLRVFPIKPRLERLFSCAKTARLMTYHHTAKRHVNGDMSHPRDTIEWKQFDRIHPTFSNEPRNVRLGLASDGFSTFKVATGGSRSTWPVVLAVYNLPSQFILKKPFLMLALLIEGPKSPCNDIDVYLQPLIDELKELWIDGVDTYDAATHEFFKMRAAVLWTINDFPAYGNLSGWKTKGYKACPHCHVNDGSIHLEHSCKCVYLRHRRFLPIDHPWRSDYKHFNGQEEHDTAPVRLSGDDVIEQWEGIPNITFGKLVNNNNREVPLPIGWSKKSIFFELPYWRTLILRHNLDVMHIEKNVCENILTWLLEKDGKIKDINARRDMENWGVRRSLLPKTSKKTGNTYLPYATYNMSKEEKEVFLDVFKDIKLPDGFSSRISKLVDFKGRKMFPMKTHDFHIVMQHLLPLALRSSLPKQVGLALNDLCTYFRELCSKTINVDTMEKLEKSIPVILCKLEKIFPPAFFDVTVHLTIHLATEAKIAGPVWFRWMYPIERYLLTLKNYVRNRSRPEGSIAEGYLIEEVTTFCALYLEDANINLRKPSRSMRGPIGAATSCSLSGNDSYQAHRFILFNSPSIQPFLEFHRKMIKLLHSEWSDAEVQFEQHHNFVGWFRENIDHLRANFEVPEEVRWLARGPRQSAQSYHGYLVNGYKFETRSMEDGRVTQNSGVATTDEQGNIYCGVLDRIIEVAFSDEMIMHLFKCTWYKVVANSKPKKNDYNFKFIDITRTVCDDEPFIYPPQAQQIFYSSDPTNGEYKIVCNWKPRETYEVGADFFFGEDQEEKIEAHGCSYSGNQSDFMPSVNMESCIPDEGPTLTEDTLCVRKELGRGIIMSKKLLKLAYKSKANKRQRGK